MAEDKPKIRYVMCTNCKVRCSRADRTQTHLVYACSRCGLRVSVEPTQEERTCYFKTFEQLMQTDVRDVWEKFERFFLHEDTHVDEGLSALIGERAEFSEFKRWKWAGYELMRRVYDYVEACPEITLVCCDDHECTTSYLVLIPFRDTARGPQAGYVGTKVIFMSQGQQEPAVFWLHPRNVKALMQGFREVRKVGLQPVAP